MNKRDINELITVVLNRPRMYAQNPASLEDQFCLLFSLVNPRFMPFRAFILRETGKGYGPLCQILTDSHGREPTIEEVAEILRKFWGEYQTNERIQPITG